MPTMHTHEGERALDTAWRAGDLPDLTAIDRFALRLGLRLILRGQHAIERAERAEQARVSRAADSADAARDRALERRALAGSVW